MSRWQRAVRVLDALDAAERGHLSHRELAAATSLDQVALQVALGTLERDSIVELRPDEDGVYALTARAGDAGAVTDVLFARGMRASRYHKAIAAYLREELDGVDHGWASGYDIARAVHARVMILLLGWQRQVGLAVEDMVRAGLLERGGSNLHGSTLEATFRLHRWTPAGPATPGGGAP